MERDNLVPANRNDRIGQNRSPSEVVPNIPVGPNDSPVNHRPRRKRFPKNKPTNKFKDNEPGLSAN